jgi:hypothetical protein
MIQRHFTGVEQRALSKFSNEMAMAKQKCCNGCRRANFPNILWEITTKSLNKTYATLQSGWASRRELLVAGSIFWKSHLISRIGDPNQRQDDELPDSNCIVTYDHIYEQNISDVFDGESKVHQKLSKSRYWQWERARSDLIIWYEFVLSIDSMCEWKTSLFNESSRESQAFCSKEVTLGR